MKINEKHQFHGSALAQIVEHSSFKALNLATPKYGHYQVNNNKRILIKHRSGMAPWVFVFSPDETKTIASDIGSKQSTFAVLVCGTTTVCILSADDLQQLINLNSTSGQSITVNLPPNRSMRVTGSLGSLNHTVAHSDFPALLFS